MAAPIETTLAAEILGCRSRVTGEVFFPPRPMGSGGTFEEMETIRLSGEGVLEAFTVVHIAPSAMIAAGYGREHPYCVGIVRLKEGPAISAQILEVDCSHPEGIRIGMPLTAVNLDRGGQSGVHLCFRPRVG